MAGDNMRQGPYMNLSEWHVLDLFGIRLKRKTDVSSSAQL